MINSGYIRLGEDPTRLHQITICIETIDTTDHLREESLRQQLVTFLD